MIWLLDSSRCLPAGWSFLPTQDAELSLRVAVQTRLTSSVSPPTPAVAPDGAPPDSGETLILDGLCLHVLSSFQGTGKPGNRPRPMTALPLKGEPYNFRIAGGSCQPSNGRGQVAKARLAGTGRAWTRRENRAKARPR
jgi:hypothetical protein